MGRETQHSFSPISGLENDPLIQEALKLGCKMEDVQKIHVWDLTVQVGNWTVKKTMEGTDEQMVRHINNMNGLLGSMAAPIQQPTPTVTADKTETVSSNGIAPHCPEHSKELRNNGRGWFCPTPMKDYPQGTPAADKEWCKYTVASQ